MPIRIDAAFQNAQDITLDAFRAPDGVSGDLHDRTIEVDGRTFRISFANPNAPSVRFASYELFNNLFRASRRTDVLNRLKDLVARHSVAKDLGEVATVTGFRENVQRAIRSEMSAISRKAGGKFALYGFSTVRDPTVRPIGRLSVHVGKDGVRTRPIHAQLINGYNESIGLRGEDESAALTIAFVRDNDRNRWDCNNLEEGDGSVTEKDRADWLRYLRWHDIDLFSKIRKARAEATAGKRTGWAGEIARNGLTAAVHDMVRKNLDPRVITEIPDVNLVIGAVADAILEIVDTDFGNRDRTGIEEKIEEIVARRAPADKAALVRRILDHVSMTAFWRQTSKLGLDFFKSRGETVVFDWTTFDGKRTNGAELGDKWWKDGEADVADHFGVAITNSEMRHLGSAKYANVLGTGRIVRIQGALAAKDAGKIAAEQIAQFDSFDRETLDTIVRSLEAGFERMDAKAFHDLAVDALSNLPFDAKDDYIDLDDNVINLRLLNDLCARALGRLRARIADAPSTVVKAALLASAADAFQSEILKDPEIVRKWNQSLRLSRDEVRPGVPGPLVLRRLAGVERGLGGRAFFSSRTGRPNELGRCLFNAGGDVMDRVAELRRAFAAAFGIAEENALAHPAFMAFIPRVAREANGNFAEVIGAMNVVRTAYDAKEAVLAHLRARIPIQPEEHRIFNRRGEWDLDRLVYREAVRAQRLGRPVDLDLLRRNGEVICDICVRAQAFVLEFARRINPDDEPGLRLSEDEVRRLTDAYLDREGSAVNAYRLNGSEDDVKKFDDEAETALLRSTLLLLELQDRAITYRKNARALRALAANFRTRFRLGMPLVHQAPAKRTSESRASAPERVSDPKEAMRKQLEERDRKAVARVRELESRANELDARADLLTDVRLKSIVINSVAMRGKRFHGMAAMMLYRALKSGEPLPTDVGTTTKEKLKNFARALADRVKDAWLRAIREESHMDAIGYDDCDKALQMAFSIYLKETPEVKEFLDREVEEDVGNEIVSELNENIELIPPGDPIRYVMDVVLTHGKL